MPEGALICPSCIPKLSPVRQPTCKKCGKEVFADHIEFCPDCMRRKRSFDSGVALLNYNAAAQKSMAAIKYKNKREYLDFYAEAIFHRYGNWAAHQNAEALVPVPVHPDRLRQRGFNQAEELADRLGRLMEIPVLSDLLGRVKKTAPQKGLSAAERLKNLQEAFAVSGNYGGTGKRNMPDSVILVDDIYTTGSTVEACSRVLKAAGVKRVFFIVICIGANP